MSGHYVLVSALPAKFVNVIATPKGFAVDLRFENDGKRICLCCGRPFPSRGVDNVVCLDCRARGPEF
jgi:hypothetical protein